MKNKRIHTRRQKQRQRLAIFICLNVLAFLVGFMVAQSTPQACEADTITTDPAPTVHLIDEYEVQTYTEEELELLALVIYQEAGSDTCSDDTRLKVGTVVMNRVADPRFPDTIRGVVLQRAQYGRLYWTGPKWPKRASRAAEAHAVARAYDCAEQVLRGYRALPADVVYQAEFVQGDGVVAQQDGFYFCRWEV